MAEYSSTKYRIPVVDGKIVFVCVKCGEIIKLTCESPSMDIYESPDCVCESCRVVKHLKVSLGKGARRVAK